MPGNGERDHEHGVRERLFAERDREARDRPVSQTERYDPARRDTPR